MARLSKLLLPVAVADRRRASDEKCYLCGRAAKETPEGQLTRDHLPPKNLFLPPRPSDLITVPCCYQCNNDSHEDDEYLRVAVTACYNTNPVGKKTWEEKTVGSTVRKKRLSKSIDKMAVSLKRIALITPEGRVLDAFEGKIDRARVDGVLTRMTKGFLSRLYPEIERSELSFQAEQIDPFKLNDPLFRFATSQLFRFQRGHAVFRCWHGVEEYSHTGMWVHMFFDSAVYVVSHTSDRRIVMPW